MDRLYQALPILFTWEIVFLPLAVIALNHRCRVAEMAYKAGEEEKRLLILKGERSREASSEGSTRTDSIGEKVKETEANAQAEAKEANLYSPSIPPPV